MNTLIKYWSYLVENEDKEISFESFLKEKSNLFEASMKWPDDYLKKAKDRIMNSPLGKSDWYKENHIDKDLIDNFKNRFETLRHKGDFTLGFFLSIIKWFIEYSGSDFNKYQEFIEGKLDKIIGILNYIVSQKDDENSKFHEISKTEKAKDGNPLVLKFKKLKDMNWNTFDKEVFQKYSDQISKSVELDKDSLKKSDYEAIPIYSYDELHDKFGGDKTGYKGQSEWCHTNGRGTYDSRAWTDNGTYMFIVFAKKGWENITPPDPSKTTTAYDDYGISLIACLFDTNSKKLLHSTLRWNHVIDPAKTKIGASVDNAFKNENDLMNTVGINILTELDEYFKKFKEINKIITVTIGGKDFTVKNGNIDCSHNKLISLDGAPKEIDGYFDCENNKLTSLEGAPQEVKGKFNCSKNKLTSLVGAPQEVGEDFDCYDNKLTSLQGGPQKVGGNFQCSTNLLNSLKGCPKEIGRSFYCRDNQLTSLEGAPEYVGGSFICRWNQITSLRGVPREVDWGIELDNNQITSLEGAPEKVRGGFECTYNKLTSLKGAPKEVGRGFICYRNQLTSLQGGPQKVGGDFKCQFNKLTSLEGAPQEVGEDFYCYDNQLTSLVGAPEKIGGNFSCYDNQLTSLRGSPQKVGGYFDCGNNSLTSLEGAPKEIGGNFSCSGNEDLPEYKVDAYRAYLELSDSEKASLTKNNHYYPTEEWENRFK